MNTKDKIRCPFPRNDREYIEYHDNEWGIPEHNDQLLFEKLILDGFQAGLSWITILKKRSNFRIAFDEFNPKKIAQYDQIKINELMNNSSIIRNRKKIESTIINAKQYLNILDSGETFDNFIWSISEGKVINNRWEYKNQIPTETVESNLLSKKLKSKGFKFCGPTICYAYMQAIGVVNDHLVNCFRHDQITTQKLR